MHVAQYGSETPASLLPVAPHSNRAMMKPIVWMASLGCALGGSGLTAGLDLALTDLSATVTDLKSPRRSCRSQRKPRELALEGDRTAQ